MRDEIRLTAPSPTRVVRAGDILVIEAEAPALANALSTVGVQLEEAKRVEPPKDAAPEETAASSDEIVLVELAVLPGSPLVGRSASDIRLRTRHGLSLLALSRQGRRSITRLRTTAFSAGDVLLPRSVYDAVDSPVIVLLAALIPVAGAMDHTGAADVIGRFLLEGIAQGHPVVGLAVILVVTMTLSDVMNNAATAAVMCPVAIGTAA